MKKNKVIAIIPARGGSKGIKDKNITPVFGQPLIYYTLEACKNTKEIDLTDKAKGIYFLEIETEDGIINKKLILQ